MKQKESSSSVLPRDKGAAPLDFVLTLRIPAYAGSDAFPLTQDFLSQMLGVRRPTITAVAGASDRFDVTLRRLQTIKKRSRATLPEAGFKYSVARGQASIKGVNGPPA